MKSHEYASKLRELAGYLESRPDFETECPKVWVYMTMYEKANLLDAVAALKPGKKTFTDGSYPQIEFEPVVPEGTMIRVTAQRHLACTKVQDAVWECEPLLKPEEEQALGEAQMVPDDDIPF